VSTPQPYQLLDPAGLVGFDSPHGVVYVLLDPGTREVRYVGQSRQHPLLRLKNHIQDPAGNQGKRAWLQALRRQALLPVLMVLEVLPLDQLAAVEAGYIEAFHALGAPISNKREPKKQVTQ
jgi:hypothetical protein